MPQATGSVSIARPAHDVFIFVADGTNASKWRSGVLDVALVSGEGAGALYKQGVSGPGGRRVSADYRVTSFEPDRSFGFETTSGPVRPTGRFDFEPADGGGTRVTFSLQAELGGLKKLLMGKMVQRTMDAEVGALSKLKQVLEQPSA
jgi:carbon monoxide dehydrogenase subunit G